MKWVCTLSKYTASFFLLISLVFASGVFSVLLYGKISGKQWAITFRQTVAFASKDAAPLAAPAVTPPQPVPDPKKASVLLEAPAIRQFPELPSGCEITSMAMLLQFAGIEKSKMDLVKEMKKDPTPMVKSADGSISYWGNPNTGFVGDITGKTRGFGIYHAGLFGLLQSYAPKAVDLTGGPFERLEDKLSEGVPVVAWTTLDYRAPSQWVVWDTPLGPIQTTFMEHAVLLVGYDEENVYVNDPQTGKAQVKIQKEGFVSSWEAMGRQALSYDKE